MIYKKDKKSHKKSISKKDNKSKKKSHKKQKGSAKKGRKKRSKSKQEFQYTAPRVGKDGKMTKASLSTYIPMEESARDKAATRIQSLTRGRQSRKTKSDMRSDWYRGFPGQAPDVPLDLNDISRITDRAIQGMDSRRERENIESKIREADDRYRTELDKLGEFDELKYDWGKFYSGKDLTRIPTSADDELLIPREEIIEATDYYKDRNIKQDKLTKKHHDYMVKYGKLDQELDKKLELDIEKCLHAKKLAKADIKLYKDAFFMENYYEPCSDNENLTKIYVDTFYSLPWELIQPASRERFGETTDDMIHNIPRENWKNSLITVEGQDKLREILVDQGLRTNMSSLSRLHPHNYVRYGYGSDWALNTVVELANFFRWARPGNIKLVHLSGKPIIHSNLPGRSHLQETFNMLDSVFVQNPSYFNGNVEKVKRYLILRLIGIFGNPEYPEILQDFIDTHTQMISDRKVNLKHFKKELEIHNKVIDDIIRQFRSEEISDKDRDKFIKDYKNGLLAGLDEQDDDRIHFYNETLIQIKSDISKIENELPKLEKKLESAKRFSRITGTPKDYMTWEPEKLIYE